MLTLRDCQYIKQVAACIAFGNKPPPCPNDISQSLSIKIQGIIAASQTPLSPAQAIKMLNSLKESIQTIHDKGHSTTVFARTHQEQTATTAAFGQTSSIETAYTQTLHEIETFVHIEKTKEIIEKEGETNPSDQVTLIVGGVDIRCHKEILEKSEDLNLALRLDARAVNPEVQGEYKQSFDQQLKHLRTLLQSGYTNESGTRIGFTDEEIVELVKNGEFDKKVLQAALAKASDLKYPISNTLRSDLQLLVAYYRPNNLSNLVEAIEPEVMSAVLRYLYTGKVEIPEDLESEFNEACQTLHLPKQSEEVEEFSLLETQAQSPAPAKSLKTLENLSTKILEESADKDREKVDLTHVAKGVQSSTLGLIKGSLIAAYSTAFAGASVVLGLKVLAVGGIPLFIGWQVVVALDFLVPFPFILDTIYNENMLELEAKRANCNRVLKQIQQEEHLSEPIQEELPEKDDWEAIYKKDEIPKYHAELTLHQIEQREKELEKACKLAP